jgi:hypothetical protein
MDRAIYMTSTTCRTYISDTECEEVDMQLSAFDEKELASLQEYIEAQYTK